MAVVNPPEITPAPTPAPQRGERATFKERVDAFITWLTLAVMQFAALAQNVYANAQEAAAKAGDALGYSNAAQQFRDNAQAARDAAQGYRDTAMQHRDDARAARDAAQVYAAALTATSTTSLTVATGSKAFTTQAGKQFSLQQVLYFVNPGNAAQWMAGTVTTYTGPDLVANITDVSTSAAGQTVANWVISVSGIKGAKGDTGGITGGTMTGPLTLMADPAAPLQAATKQYVDNSLNTAKLHAALLTF